MYDQALFLQTVQLHHARPCHLYMCESNLSSPAAALHLKGLIFVSDVATCSVNDPLSQCIVSQYHFKSVCFLPAAPHMTDDGGANLGKRARKRPRTFTTHAHNDRLKKPKVDKVDQPVVYAGSIRQTMRMKPKDNKADQPIASAVSTRQNRLKKPKDDKADQPVASAGSIRQNDKPKSKGKSKQKHQTGSRRQLHVKTKAVTHPQPTSLLQPVLRRSDRLKRKIEGMEDAEADVSGGHGQPNKRARTAVNAVGMDEAQPGAVFSADAALASECSNVRLKTVGRGAAKDSSKTKHTTRRRLHRTSGIPVACNVLHNQ